MHTKHRIIQSGIKNFLRYGYEKTSLTMIADEIGIKKPSLYYHFKNKEAIFRASVEYILSSMNNRLNDAQVTSSSAKELLEGVLSGIIGFHSDLSIFIGEVYNKPVNIYPLLHEASYHFPALGTDIKNHYAELQEQLEAIISRGQNESIINPRLSSESLALEIIAWLEGLILLSTFNPGLDLNSIRQKVFSNLWEMIGSHETASSQTSLGKRIAKTISLGTKW